MTPVDLAKFVIWLTVLSLVVTLGTLGVDALAGEDKTLAYALLGRVMCCIFYAKIANLLFRPIWRYIDSVGK